MIATKGKPTLKQECGATLLTILFFLVCLCGLVSLLLVAEQASITQMRLQQTADLITKGARTAGKWEYETPSGRTKKRLIATTREAQRRKADIIRGAREEAEILYKLNKAALEKESELVSIIHQQGEKKSLYSSGIYHVYLSVEKQVEMVTDSFKILFQRVSQSGVYDG